MQEIESEYSTASNIPRWRQGWNYASVAQGDIRIVVHPNPHDGDWLASITNPYCGCPYHRQAFDTMDEAQDWVRHIVERDTGLDVVDTVNSREMAASLWQDFVDESPRP